jgi:hypothetical protein
MTVTIKRNSYLKAFNALNHDNIKFQSPLILKMFGALNQVNLRFENRYILCNFLDKYSDLLDEKEDIYSKNNQKTLNQLLILAINKAKEYNLLKELYEDYINSIHAISEKKEFQHIKLEF